MLTTQLLRHVITESYKIEIEKLQNQTNNFTGLVARLDILKCIAENNIQRTVTYSSVVAGWHADQKDAGSILLSFFLLLFYFKSEGHWFKSSEQ